MTTLLQDAGGPADCQNEDFTFRVAQSLYSIPRHIISGTHAGEDPIRVGIFAGIHGDEPEGIHALRQFTQLLTQQPELASGYRLFIYPLLNPTGFEKATRHNHSGKDLNREFWSASPEAEVAIIERELLEHQFHGIISLHTDDSSDGFYGYAHGATITRELLEPALKAAEDLLPRNRQSTIDGFTAYEGIIHDKFPGILSAPPQQLPKPFEIILETPKKGPEFLKESALVLSLQTILQEYKRFISYASDL